MKKIRTSPYLVALVCLALLSIGQSASGQTSEPNDRSVWQVTQDLQISELQPGLWVHTSFHTFDNGVRFPSNGLIVRQNGALLLIDTAWGNPSTEALLDWIDAELELDVSAVISTHAHDDRMGGAPAVAEHGIPLYASPLSREAALGQGWPEPLSIGELAAGESMEFGAVEIFYPGPAHTADNIMVWLPERRLLVGGCAVKSADATGMGYVGDADLDGWPDAIRRTIERYPGAEQVLPGHGAMGGPDLLDHTLQLLDEREQAQSADHP